MLYYILSSWDRVIPYCCRSCTPVPILLPLVVVGKIPGYLISKVESSHLHLLVQSFHRVASMTRPIAALRAIRRITAASMLEGRLARPAVPRAVAAGPAVRQFRQYSTHPSKPPKQGQPLHHSHPHLVGSKHLTPGIPASEYEDRRKKLMESLGDGAVVICMGNTVRLVTQRMSPPPPNDCKLIRQKSCKLLSHSIDNKS